MIFLMKYVNSGTWVNNLKPTPSYQLYYNFIVNKLVLTEQISKT